METSPDDSERTAKRPAESSPMATKEPKVTRFKKKPVLILCLIAALLVAVTLIGAVTKQKVQAQEPHPGEKGTAAASPPQLPDPLISGPANYNELRHDRPSPMTVSTLQPGTPQEAGQLQPSYPIRPAGPESSPPQGHPSQKEQALKEALASPVTFNVGDPSQRRSEQPVQGGEMPAAGFPPVVPFPSEPEMKQLLAVSDDQNMQGEKRGFAGQRKQDLPYLSATVLAPLSRYELKAGSILPALLITGINSDLPGQLVAQLRENVYDTVTGDYLLIPQGTRLIGEYDSKIAFGQERVLVVWTRVIMPNGHSMSLEGMPGIDLSGYAGITGAVNDHYGKLVTGVVLGSVIGAGAQVAVGGQGAPNIPPSFGQLAVSGAATNINQAAQQHTQKVLNLQPTIEVAPGDKINVFVTKDMVLKPYTE